MRNESILGALGCRLLALLLLSLLPGCTRAGDEGASTPSPSGVGGGVGAEMGSQEKEGPVAESQTVILAGGCFWGLEDLLRKIDGVLDTDVGYCGGENANATYEFHPGHAEAVRLVFDPARISLDELLVNWFFRMHDPTTVDRQGNDRGSSYRSTIFYFDEAQMAAAERAIRIVDAAARWPGPIVTTVEPVRNWSPGEGYHQDYLIKNPGGYTCHFLREWTPIPIDAP